MTSLLLKPSARVTSSSKSSFAGLTSSLQNLSLAPSTSGRSLKLIVEASRVCQLTGKKANNGYVVTFSHKRNKKLQEVNLQYKKIFWPEAKRWVKLRVSTKALKTIEKNGLQAMAKEAGINLASLPYVDASPVRQEYLAAHPQACPQAKNVRRMKNPEKLAASKKKPLVPTYIAGGRIAMVRSE
ncbi:hypothetical protein WJX72_001689 [[Myrmecia] bisecta]|uniref:Large ribosomal subunit protein bL28c n=1 Tax=[Myrmecia] bisecta TaxID=41462 RepID=A0AAW1QE89_9CHLO